MPTAKKTTKTPMIVRTFQRRLDMTLLPLCIRGLNDGRLTLEAADRRAGDPDPHLRIVGNLELHQLLVDLRNLAVDAAGRDHLVVHFQVVEKLLHLLLLPLRRQQDDEVEDPQDQRERNELKQRARAITHHAHGEHGISRRHHESWGWRDKLWWSATLKLSNRPNAIASLIRLIVSREKFRLCNVLK